jgi:hypothetical protein
MPCRRLFYLHAHEGLRSDTSRCRQHSSVINPCAATLRNSPATTYQPRRIIFSAGPRLARYFSRISKCLNIILQLLTSIFNEACFYTYIYIYLFIYLLCVRINCLARKVQLEAGTILCLGLSGNGSFAYTQLYVEIISLFHTA